MLCLYSVYFIYFCYDLYNFFLLLTSGFIYFFIVPLGVRLDCLFGIFLVSWGRLYRLTSWGQVWLSCPVQGWGGGAGGRGHFLLVASCPADLFLKTSLHAWELTCGHQPLEGEVGAQSMKHLCAPDHWCEMEGLHLCGEWDWQSLA